MAGLDEFGQRIALGQRIARQVQQVECAVKDGEQLVGILSIEDVKGVT